MRDSPENGMDKSRDPETPENTPSFARNEREDRETINGPHPAPETLEENETGTLPKRKGKAGGKPGNGNAVRHGLDANLRHGLVGGKLPKGCQYIEKRVNSLRRQVERIVLETKGQISFTDSANINSILKWERHGLLANHWLREQNEKLSPLERLKFSETIAKASDNRDRAIKALKLERDTNEDILNTLYAKRSDL